MLTAHPDATATLYVAYAGNSGTAGTYYLETLRSGNSGQVVPNDDWSTGYTYTSPPLGVTGSSSPIAWRTCAPDGTGGAYAANGNGIYMNQDPANGGGTPWITPSSFVTPYGAVPGRSAGSGPDGPAAKVSAGEPIQYDTGVLANSTATGKYIGYLGNTGIYGVEDLLGIWGGEGRSYNQNLANVLSAGQLLNGQNADGSGTATTFGAADIISGADPAGLGLPANSPGWLAIDLSPVMLYELAYDSQMKGLVFAQNLPGTTVTSGWEFFANSGGFTPYLVVTPEPATLCLLVIGGIGLLRRRC